MTIYLAICARLAGNELIEAECENLTGGKPAQDGVAVCQTVANISRAAYVHTGLRLIAQAETITALSQGIAEQSFAAESFRIEYLRLSEQNPVRWKEAVVAIANTIKDFPDLERPKYRFLLVAREKELCFGEIVTESRYTYQKHDAKPHRTSTSLPSRVARALVNLVAPPAETILDPCCGTGSILLEAQAIGLRAFGSDKNQRMVRMTSQNLEHFGYAVEVDQADIGQCKRTADALVTDLPYGRFMRTDEDSIRAIVQQALPLAPVAVFVAGQDISDSLLEVGYREIQVFQIRKHKAFSRYVHRAKSGMFD